jgi:hypothetical protein
MPEVVWKQGAENDLQNRDENIDYYVAKLDELVKKFAVVTPASGKDEALLL